MKIVKGILITLGIVIVLFLAAAILVPVLFKDKILTVVKKEMNDQLNATADFKDVDLSLFRNFPNLSVAIIDLSVVGKAPFEHDTLLSAKSINVALNLFKVFGGQYEIVHIGLNTPRIHAIVLPTGIANWNITKPAPAATPTTPAAPQPFDLKLKRYSIDNAYIEYNDQQGKMHLIIQNLNHGGSGDFSSSSFTLSTKTSIDALTFIMGNIPYLNELHTKIDLDLQIDTKSNKYTFNTDKIQLNGLKLSTKGFVTMPDTTNMNMDIQFSTPSNDFKDVLSLIPSIYQSGFKDIKTSGKLVLNGTVKGNFNKKEMPSFTFNMDIMDGAFQYPALPQKVSDIQMKLAVNNPDGVIDHTVVNLEKFHVALGTQIFDLHLLLKTPMTDQWIDAGAKGNIDLGQVQQLVTLEAGTKMAGNIQADVAVKGSMAAAQKKEFDKLDASGTISMKNIFYASKDYPDGVKLDNMLLTFTPKNVALSELKGQYMGTTFSGNGAIDNMLGFYLRNEVLSGSFKLNADKLDVKKFMPAPPPTPAKPTPAPTDPFLVPANLNIDLSVSVGTLKFDSLILENMVADMAIANETMSIKSLTAKGLDGMIKMSGSYSTENNKKHPDISFVYGLENVDVQKTYTTFNTVQKLMPAAKCIAGKVTSNFNMTGSLNPDMSPEMNSLTGRGDLLLNNCVLSNLPAADQLADKLHLTQFKRLNINDTKILFSFEHGRVTIQPYKTKLAGMDAEIAGSHGFDNTMQYGLNISVPKTLMGGAATDLVNGWVSQAAAKGVPIKIGDKIDISATITGTMNNPKIETNLKSTANNAINSVKDAIKQEVQQKVDSVKKVVKDTVKALKNQAVNTAKDEVKKQLANPNTGDKKVDDAVNKAKNGLNDLFHKKK